MDEEDSLHRFRKGKAGLSANLEDFAYGIWMCLELHQSTGKNSYLSQGIAWTKPVEAHFKDPETGAYFFTSNQKA